MADSPYRYFSNLYTSILQDFKEQTTTSMVTLAKRWINEAQEQVIVRKKRDYLNKTYHYKINGQVDSTFTVTNGSTTVTKTGTATLPITATTSYFSFKAQGFDEVYEVSSFTSSTLTLASAYTGDTSTAASGVFFQTGLQIDTDIRSVHKVYHERDGQVLVMSKGVEDFKDLAQRDPAFTGFASYWTLFGYANQTVTTVDDRRKMLLYPYAEEDYTLHVDANIFIPRLSSDTDEPVIPLQYRQILYWYGIMKLGQYHQDADMIKFGTSNYNSWLDRLDGEFMPARDLPRIFYDNTRWAGRRGRSRKLFRFER